MKLSPHLKRTYEFIKEYVSENGYSPTLEEIAHGTQMQSRGTLSRYVHQLADFGLITLAQGQRKIQLVEIAGDDRQINLLGKIAAGHPIEALSLPQPLDIEKIIRGKATATCYALEVKGDSMIEEGILEGDIIICSTQETARNGEIVVALIDNQEATLKRFYNNQDGTITLAPANALMKPLIYSSARIKIQGIFNALIRINR